MQIILWFILFIIILKILCKLFCDLLCYLVYYKMILINVSAYQLSINLCKISTNKHSANKKIIHGNIMLNCHLLI